MHIGIDLGTTFCCVAYVDNDGIARVIPNSDGEQSTPSIIWFDGKNAIVGKKADEMKHLPGQYPYIYEFVKRDMGKPIETPANIHERDPYLPETKPYEVGGFKYGAAGMSAIILKKLRLEAIRFLCNRGLLDEKADDHYPLEAVITVPAYFGDKERQDTRLAGLAAGLNVIGIINEPTAAALAYGLSRQEKKMILVFDLGGGTFDVTILETNRGDANVIASDGHNTLGGKDFDEVIQTHIYGEFSRKNKKHIPEDKGFYVQRKALEAKHKLSENEEVRISIVLTEGDLETVLYRSEPISLSLGDKFSMDDNTFYFTQRSTDLMSRCKTICNRLIEKSGLRWSDIEEVILAGGSCRMPIIPQMLEDLTGKKIRRQIEGFNYDTAIAIGAALYGHHKARVQDVVSHSVGIRILDENRYKIEHFLSKNSPLPVREERVFAADSRAALLVYEGESEAPDECILRGRIELNNPEGDVKIIMEMDANGFLKAIAEYEVNGNLTKQVLEIKNEAFMFDERLEPLREKISSISLTF